MDIVFVVEHEGGAAAIRLDLPFGRLDGRRHIHYAANDRHELAPRQLLLDLPDQRRGQFIQIVDPYDLVSRGRRR